MTALERGEPDRVPIVEWAVSRKVTKALCPTAKDQTDLEELLELEKQLRYREDCPTGRANSLPVPETSPTERAILLNEEEENGEGE